MTFVSLDDVGREHADRRILDHVTFAIDEGERVGVIGVNGSGKSTLLRLVAGVDAPDDGRVVHATATRVAFVPQEPELDPAATVMAAVVDAETAPARAVRAFDRAQSAVRAAPGDSAAMEEMERASRVMDAERAWDLERRSRALLDRLGLGTLGQARVSTLSGGQRKRVALARGLAAEAELLVLDEPTNHLDVDVVEWLESELRARAGALVLVTHDRYLLDRIATRILEVVDGEVRSGHGSYLDYLEVRALREEQEAAHERRQANRARTELAWLRRGAQARTSKSKHRVGQAWDLLDRSRPTERQDVAIDLPSRRIGTKVVNLSNVGVRFGDRWVLRGVDEKLAPDARSGIVGPNGSGKTTLLRLLGGRLEPTEGSVRTGETVVVGWYGQELEVLPPQQRLLDAVQEVVLELDLGVTRPTRKVRAPELLERFLFPSSEHKALVGQLSGGERRRLQLLRVLAEMPNLLLLDEPTNDLDLDTLAVLEEFLDDWPGAVVVASHDRYFLDRVCRDLYGIEPGGGVRHHPGGWSAWRQITRERARSARAEVRSGGTEAQAVQRRGVASGDRSGGKLGYREQRELRQLDARMATLAERRAALEAHLAEVASGPDHELLAGLGAQLSDVIAENEDAELRWLELAELEESSR